MILIMGLPNAGKTTYSKQFKDVLHLDSFPRNKFLNCNTAVKSLGGDVVVEGIYNLKCRRARLLEVSSGEKICIWIDTPLEECLRRSATGRSERIVLHCANSFEPPSLDEGWDKIIIVKENGYDNNN